MLKSEPPFLQLHLAYIPENLGPSRLNRHDLTCWVSNLLSRAFQGADFFFKDNKYSASQEIAEY
jgi:hypothetical protein